MVQMFTQFAFFNPANLLSYGEEIYTHLISKD